MDVRLTPGLLIQGFQKNKKVRAFEGAVAWEKKDRGTKGQG